jgi:excinuclease ABC subunit A
VTVLTGPSGSGKSSLAFDTVYAEGQRRFVESMSSYARQFLERIEKPDVDHIENILPAIALEQKNSVKNARSTVGTATEIYDYFRLMFANLGITFCPDCSSAQKQVQVSRAKPAYILSQLKHYADGTKLFITAPVLLNEHPFEQLLEKGYFRLVQSDGSLEEVTAEDAPRFQQGMVQVVVDRLILREKDFESKGKSRLLESIQNALALGQGLMEVIPLDTPRERKRFKNELACPECFKVFKEPTAHLFSFNSPIGACTACEGFGRIAGLDLDKVIPNKSLSLAEGAVHPFTMPSNQDVFEYLMAEAHRDGIRTDVPYEKLSTTEKRFVLEGKRKYEGIRGFFNWLETKKYKVHVRVMLAKYRGYYDCPDCLGSRLKPDALCVKVNGKTLLDLCAMPISQLNTWFEDQAWTKNQLQRSERLLKEITSRIQYLEKIGLGYLTLSRQTRTLSGGEAQRINLSTALGSALTDTLYVLDEPTVGLHARDTDRLMQVLKDLRDLENTIIVVEHDPEVILAADYVIDMGPGGGEEGGRIVFEGSVADLKQAEYSLTAQCLNHQPERLPNKMGADWQSESGKPIVIKGAKGNNLKNLTVEIPKNQLVCITGVSGSGKSTLIKQTLYTSYQREKGEDLLLDLAPCDSIEGLESFQDVVMVDQSPPGRSLRSNPVTYVKAYDEIRNLFANSRKAQVLGITPGHFSFNTPGGRCETCEGLGTVTIDMQFMADVTVICEDCKGKRFNVNVLSVDLFGRNIFDVLQMTVDEALKFFKTATKVRNKLMPLHELGLGYLRLGQSTSTLSGGEAQRLKLVSYLGQSRREGPKTLFLFDEPTTGLHMNDIQRLVMVMRKLLDAGHSLIVIEHNLDFIAHADYVIDLGPDGGTQGGKIIYQGKLEGLKKANGSLTGHYLKEFLAHRN